MPDVSTIRCRCLLLLFAAAVVAASMAPAEAVPHWFVRLVPESPAGLPDERPVHLVVEPAPDSTARLPARLDFRLAWDRTLLAFRGVVPPDSSTFGPWRILFELTHHDDIEPGLMSLRLFAQRLDSAASLIPVAGWQQPLMTLRFEPVEPEPSQPAADVRFLWLVCKDNRIILPASDTVCAAAAVFDSDLADITDPASPPPTTRGVSNSCLATLNYGDTVTIRAIDFHSAAVPLDLGTSVDPDSPPLPAGPRLFQNYPNPFNPSTTIRFALARRTRWNLGIYNLAGQLVRTFAGISSAGERSVVWDGTDRRGRPVAAGLYLYRLRTGTGTEARKMLLLK